MPSIYQIDAAIAACLDFDTGEILDFEKLEELNLEREQKIENIALYIKNLDSEAAAIKAEEEALAARRKAKENKAARLKEYLSDALSGEIYESARVRLSYRKSAKLKIEDDCRLLQWLRDNGKDDCIKVAAPEIKAGEVTKLIKAGEIVPCASLEERYNLQIR